MKHLEQKLILITGGASGIGKIMARMMLERNAQVIIWDIDQSKIDGTLSEFNSKGSIFGFKVDVSSITKTMEINANAPMLITKEFLEDMLNRNSGHICNIASSGGLISNPKMSVYVGSKWSVIGWSDSLRIEMKQMNKNINITTIMPYYINTGMFDGVHSKIPILKPEAVALKIIKAIEKNKKMLTVPGYIYRLTRFGQAIMPINIFDWFTGSVMGIYKTMEHFTGRKK